MFSLRKQKAREKRSRQSFLKSDLKRLDEMLCIIPENVYIMKTQEQRRTQCPLTAGKYQRFRKQAANGPSRRYV